MPDQNFYLASQKPTEHLSDDEKIIELLMQIEDFWKVDALLKQIHYHITNGESISEIQSLYKKIFKICAKYAISEQDRKWLYNKASNGYN